jgi:hypothetical protein
LVVSRLVALRLVASWVTTTGRAIPARALQSGRGRLRLIALAGLFCALALGGCAPPIMAADAPAVTGSIKAHRHVRAPARVPPVNPALLEPQPAPDCAFKGPLSTPPTAEETRMKLDYEAQCYRQAESIVHTRLDDLQDAVRGATRRGRR